MRRLGVVLRNDARTEEEHRLRVAKANSLRKAGYDTKVIERRTGSSLHQLKKWAEKYGLEWIKLTKGGKRA